MNQITALQPQRGLRDYTPGQLALIRKTVAKDCNADEFDLFVEICRRVGLDPFRKQIYAIVVNKDKPDKRQLVVVTGIDGYRAVAARNGDYRPSDKEPEIVYREDLKSPDSNPLGIEKAVATVYKRDAAGNWNPVVASAYWDEFAPLIENGKWVTSEEVWEDSGKAKRKFEPDGTFKLDPYKQSWRRMGRVMIAKCAEAQCCRKGWPEDLSGVYVEEELDRAMIDVTPSEAADNATADERLARINAKQAIPLQWGGGEEISYVPLGQAGDRIMAFLKHAESPTQVETWQRINAMGLRQFWALAKSDALEIKTAIENRITELSKEAAE